MGSGHDTMHAAAMGCVESGRFWQTRTHTVNLTFFPLTSILCHYKYTTNTA